MNQYQPPACDKCSDSGMRTTYILVTYEGEGVYCYKRESEISPDVYRKLVVELAEAQKRGEHPRQSVYTGAKRCECRKKGAAA